MQLKYKSGMLLQWKVGFKMWAIENVYIYILSCKYGFIKWHHIFTQPIKSSDSFSGRKIQAVTYPSSVSFAYAGLKS